MKRIIGKIVNANKKFKLIENGDKIAVGVSGGKDSVALLYALSLYQKFSNIKFDLVGITLKLGFPNMDFSKIEAFCKEKNIEYLQVQTEVYPILQHNLNKQQDISCSLCSKFKKGILIHEAKRLNCNKVAMAHHFDDAIETLFMNAIYNGYLASFKPKMYLDNSQITFIRPLILCTEREIIKDCNKNHLPIVESTCPRDKKTAREKIKKWLNNDVYKKFPQAKFNFQNMLLKPEKIILFDEEKGED